MILIFGKLQIFQGELVISCCHWVKILISNLSLFPVLSGHIYIICALLRIFTQSEAKSYQVSKEYVLIVTQNFLINPLPRIHNFTFFRVQWISGTERAIIDPLVSKWPGKKFWARIKTRQQETGLNSAMNTDQMTLTCCQDHILTENICIVWNII